MEKMTNVKALNYVLDTCKDLPEDVAERVKAMRDGYVRKAENKKPTKEQEKNVALAGKVYEFLTTVEQATATEIVEGVADEDIRSTQKAVALAKALIVEGKAEKVADKKKVYYKAIVEVAE